MGEESDREKAKEFLAKLDETIEEGPWNTTLFLRAVGKKLHDIRAKLAESLGIFDSLDEFGHPTAEQPSTAAQLADHAAERSNQQEIFISMYCTEGNVIERWEKLLLALEKQVVSRPVYGSEHDIRATIRSKTNTINEAYVAAFVKTDDILVVPPQRIPRDRQGHPLLLLKDGKFKNSFITRFCHRSGVYQYRDGKLHRQGDMSFHET